MKYFTLFYAVLYTITVCNSLKCYQCHKAFRNGQEPKCDRKVETCNTDLYGNNASCVTVKYELLGFLNRSFIYKGCSKKRNQTTAAADFKFYTANYTACTEDFCNKFEDLNVDFRLLTIIGLLFVFYICLYKVCICIL